MPDDLQEAEDELNRRFERDLEGLTQEMGIAFGSVMRNALAASERDIQSATRILEEVGAPLRIPRNTVTTVATFERIVSKHSAPSAVATAAPVQVPKSFWERLDDLTPVEPTQTEEDSSIVKAELPEVFKVTPSRRRGKLAAFSCGVALSLLTFGIALLWHRVGH